MHGTILPEYPLLGLSQRPPPVNLMAEQALLGALLTNNKAYSRVADFLKAEHFADPLHGRIYAAIQRRIEAGGVADAITLRPEFEDEVLDISEEQENGAIVTKHVLGPYYLGKLLTATVGVINAGEYGQMIYDCWIRRQLIDAGEILVNRAFARDPEKLDGREIAAETAAQLLDLAEPGSARGAVSLQEAMREVVFAAERAAVGDRPRAIPTGLPKLDRLLGGLRAPQLILVAGRPGMGKSQAAVVLAKAAATYRHGGEMPLTTLVFTLEMAADEYSQRFLANGSGINSAFIRDGQLTQQEWDRLIGAQREFEALPIVIDDRPALTLAQMRLRARTIAARQKLGLVIVDHLGLVAVPPEIGRHGPTAATTHVSQGLKQMAKELGVPVVALCQLSREVERRDDKRPMLADLRQSGSLEQDADVVIFLYRDEYYVERTEPKLKSDEQQDEFDARHATWKASMERVRGKLEMHIAKQRGGPTGTVVARIDNPTSRIWQEGDGDE